MRDWEPWEKRCLSSSWGQTWIYEQPAPRGSLKCVRRRENEQPLMGGAQGCQTPSNIWVGPCKDESLSQCPACHDRESSFISLISGCDFFPFLHTFLPFSSFKKKLFIFIWLCQALAITCRDLVLWPGIEPGLPALQERRCSPWTTKELPPPPFFFFKFSFLSSHLPFLLPKLIKHLLQEICMEGSEDESVRNLASGSRSMQEERWQALRKKRTGQKIVSGRWVKVKC